MASTFEPYSKYTPNLGWIENYTFNSVEYDVCVYFNTTNIHGETSTGFKNIYLNGKTAIKRKTDTKYRDYNWTYTFHFSKGTTVQTIDGHQVKKDEVFPSDVYGLAPEVPGGKVLNNDMKQTGKTQEMLGHSTAESDNIHYHIRNSNTHVPGSDTKVLPEYENIQTYYNVIVDCRLENPFQITEPYKGYEFSDDIELMNAVNDFNNNDKYISRKCRYICQDIQQKYDGSILYNFRDLYDTTWRNSHKKQHQLSSTEKSLSPRVASERNQKAILEARQKAEKEAKEKEEMLAKMAEKKRRREEKEAKMAEIKRQREEEEAKEKEAQKAKEQKQLKTLPSKIKKYEEEIEQIKLKLQELKENKTFLTGKIQKAKELYQDMKRNIEKGKEYNPEKLRQYNKIPEYVRNKKKAVSNVETEINYYKTKGTAKSKQLKKWTELLESLNRKYLPKSQTQQTKKTYVKIAKKSKPSTPVELPPDESLNEPVTKKSKSQDGGVLQNKLYSYGIFFSTEDDSMPVEMLTSVDENGNCESIEIKYENNGESKFMYGVMLSLYFDSFDIIYDNNEIIGFRYGYTDESGNTNILTVNPQMLLDANLITEKMSDALYINDDTGITYDDNYVRTSLIQRVNILENLSSATSVGLAEEPPQTPLSVTTNDDLVAVAVEEPPQTSLTVTTNDDLVEVEEPADDEPEPGMVDDEQNNVPVEEPEPGMVDDDEQNGKPAEELQQTTQAKMVDDEQPQTIPTEIVENKPIQSSLSGMENNEEANNRRAEEPADNKPEMKIEDNELNKPVFTYLFSEFKSRSRKTPSLFSEATATSKYADALSGINAPSGTSHLEKHALSKNIMTDKTTKDFPATNLNNEFGVLGGGYKKEYDDAHYKYKYRKYKFKYLELLKKSKK